MLVDSAYPEPVVVPVSETGHEHAQSRPLVLAGRGVSEDVVPHHLLAIGGFVRHLQHKEVHLQGRDIACKMTPCTALSAQM